MKFFSAGLTFVNVATIAGLLLGVVGRGLDPTLGGFALFLGLVAAVFAWIGTAHFTPRKVIVPPPAAAPLPKSKRARRRMNLVEEPTVITPRPDYRLGTWAIAIVFAMFAVRAFCWLVYVEGNHLKIQSVNNYGDLALHITYIKYFANGVPLWPDNPIHVFSGLRYPAGVDFFDSLFLLQNFDLVRVLVWTGLFGSLATFYGFYRWGGVFGVAGFLFNGGLAGYEFFKRLQFADYQAEKIAWKNIPLAMFVTQRGLLYAIPAGLLLLIHWRRKYYSPADTETGAPRRGLLPWWVEWSLYATMPFFHVHTFLALSILLGFWLLFGQWEMRKQIGILLAASFIPATWIVWMITDHFQAGSILSWAPGWVESDPGFAVSALQFWFVKIPATIGFWVWNFGLTVPALLALVGLVCWRFRKKILENNAAESGRALFLSSLGLVLTLAVFAFVADGSAALQKLSPGVRFIFLILFTVSIGLTIITLQSVRSFIFGSFAFVVPAAGIFLFAIFVKTAPWGWDNTKLIIWAYFICLPFLWELIVRWPWPVQVAICVLLFTSGAVSLTGGMANCAGFDIEDRTEVAAVGDAVRKLPIKDRFAAFPTFNHPLLLNGRKMVLGYPGHLWTQGFDYAPVEQQLKALMLGGPDWRDRARTLRARYIFWGREEKGAYSASKQPWREAAAVVAKGPWGTIYDVEQPASKVEQ